MTAEPPRDASLPPGYDEEDPYEGEDLSTYPEWWRRNVEEFRAHRMRPYRPPRFSDDELSPPLVRSLAEELGVDIRFQTRNPQDGGQWFLVVDGEAVEPVEHVRSGEGFTRYEMSSTRFEELVRGAVADSEE